MTITTDIDALSWVFNIELSCIKVSHQEMLKFYISMANLWWAKDVTRNVLEGNLKSG